MRSVQHWTLNYDGKFKLFYGNILYHSEIPWIVMSDFCHEIVCHHYVEVWVCIYCLKYTKYVFEFWICSDFTKHCMGTYYCIRFSLDINYRKIVLISMYLSSISIYKIITIILPLYENKWLNNIRMVRDNTGKSN